MRVTERYVAIGVHSRPIRTSGIIAQAPSEKLSGTYMQKRFDGPAKSETVVDLLKAVVVMPSNTLPDALWCVEEPPYTSICTAGNESFGTLVHIRI